MNAPTPEDLTPSGLKRETRLTISLEKINASIDALVLDRGKTHKEPGFRPGRVPLARLRLLFGDSVRRKAYEAAIETATMEWLREAGHVPALAPQYTIEKGGENEDLVCTLSYELTPQLPEISLDGLSFKKAQVTLTASDVEAYLEEWAEGAVKLVPHEVPRPAEKGDVLTVKVTFKKQPPSDQDLKEIQITLDEEKLGQHLYNALCGAMPGQIVHVPQLSDKEGLQEATPKDPLPPEMAIEVVALSTAVPLGVCEELAVKKGFENLEKMRERVKEILQEDAERLAFLWTKRQILDFFDHKYVFELPEGLVNNEKENVWRFTCEQLGIPPTSPQDEKAQKEREDLFREHFRRTEEEMGLFCAKAAVRRVRLGYILNALTPGFGIEVTREELQKGFQNELYRYAPSEHPQIIQFYRDNPQALQKIRGPILEEKLLRALAETVPHEVEEKTLEALKTFVEDIKDF